jgi:spore coat protein CotH
MKRIILSGVIALSMVAAFALTVAPGNALQFPPDGFGPPGMGFGGPPDMGFGGPPGMGPGGGMSGDKQSVKLLEKFDKDGDKMLNAEERKAARAYLASSSGQGGFGGRGGGGMRGGRGMGGSSEAAKPGAKLSPADVKSGGAAPLYDPNTLRTFFLQFEDSDWEKELEDFRNTDVDVPATLIVDGKTYKDVGIHFHGMTSYMMVPTGRKRSLNLRVDYVHNEQTVGGYRLLNLLNASEDPTFLHTVLYSELVRAYMPAPKANFSRVVINGESWGIYTNLQHFNKEFTRDFFNSEGGTRWKVPGPNPQGGLRYLGDDPASYKSTYQIKSKDKPKSWEALIKLCKTLNQEPPKTLETALAPMLDIEGALKFLALDIVSANGDGFWSRQSDYSLYLDEKGRFHILPYDMNETFRGEEGEGMGGGPPGMPGGGFGGSMPGALTQEQRTMINEAVKADMAALTQKLTDAQKDAVKATLDKNATDAIIKAKIDAISQIQTEIAMLQFTKGIKAITLTNEQKTEMEASSSMAYQQLFGGGDGNRSGMSGFGRRGRGGPGGGDFGGPGMGGGPGFGMGGPMGGGPPGMGGGPPGMGGGPMMGGGGTSLDPLTGADSGQNPLMSKLLAVPALRAKYLEIVRDIAQKSLDWERLGPIVRRYHDLIADNVKADTRKLYSTEAFESGVKAIESFATTRRTYLLSRTEPKKAPKTEAALR